MSIFDGMTGILSDVLGDPVDIHPGGGAAITVQAVFRRKMVEAEGEDGEGVLASVPHLRLQAEHAAGLGEGDLVIADGERWEIAYPVPSESPATDRFELFVLRKEAP